MAVITPSSLISEIRGSVGDVTYSRNQFGPYVKAKLTQPASATAPQVYIRDAMAEGVTAWQSISDAEFEIWKRYVVQHLKIENISRKITLSAYNEFVGRYVNRALVDTGLSGFKAEPPVRNFPVISEVAQSFESIELTMASENFQTDCAYIIYAAAPVSESVRSINKSNYKYLTFVYPSGSPETLDIFTLYNTMFSLTSADVGKRIGLAIKAVNSDNYAGSPKAYTDIILDGSVISAPPEILQSRGLNQNNLGSQTISFVSTPTQGNLLVIVIGIVGIRTITPPSGWTSFQYEAASGVTIEGFWKVAGNSESNSYTFTTTGTPNWYSTCYEITGADTTTPIQFSSDNNNGGVAGKVLNSASAAEDVDANTLVIACLMTNGTANTTTFSNSFLAATSVGTIHQDCYRRYFSSDTAENQQFNWQTNRTASSLFFGINPA